MKKSEFIDLVAEKAEMSKSAAARVVEAIFDAASGAISEAVNTAGQLSIPGFGKFTTKKRAARSGRNPRTGMVIQIPERTTVSFSPGKGLKERAGGKSGGGRKKSASKTAGSARKSSAGATKSGGSTAKKSSGATAKKSTATKTTAERSTAKKSSGGTARKSGATKSGGGGAKKSSGGSRGGKK